MTPLNILMQLQSLSPIVHHVAYKALRSVHPTVPLSMEASTFPCNTCSMHPKLHLDRLCHFCTADGR